MIDAAYSEKHGKGAGLNSSRTASSASSTINMATSAAIDPKVAKMKHRMVPPKDKRRFFNWGRKTVANTESEVSSQSHDSQAISRRSVKQLDKSHEVISDNSQLEDNLNRK